MFCHGNGGNIGDRAPHTSLLAAVGFDVLLFDYRGYGRSAGRPGEEATYADARAARAALLAADGVDPARVVYLGESLGAAVALELAVAHPPAGLILQSPFTSIRDIARVHYPFIPRTLVPDAYPSLDRIPRLRAPLLVLHGAGDAVVPLMHGEELFHAAPEPKRLEVFSGAAHNDLGGERWADLIAGWFQSSVSLT
ncbi:MAG TPA: alpha/beta hydrolase [Solirubrobacteraceae bacterium]|nr:alpha/beta hydrolase [Solirubrobacteraceae bacterium]